MLNKNEKLIVRLSNNWFTKSLIYINESINEENKRIINISLLRRKEKNMEEKIKLNKEGYEDYLKSISEKEKQLADLRMYKGKDAIFQGDNWHDNPTLYQAELQEVSLMKEISDMKKKIQNIESKRFKRFI